MFNFHYWSRTFTITTASAAVFPLAVAFGQSLLPSLARHSSFSIFVWLVCFLGYYLHLIQVARSWRKSFGLLNSSSPRTRLSKRDMYILKLRSMVSFFGRAAAVFLGASDRASKPWLHPTVAAMPGPEYFVRVHLYVIAMDGLFYCVHRMMHSNRFLFKHIHSVHHALHSPTPISAIHDHMLEKIFNSFIQVYLASCIVPMPFWYLHFTSYAVFMAELLGHSGVAGAFSPPYTPLLDVLGVEITIEHHDLHHRKVHHNFGKQTMLWDHVFNTILPNIETSKDGKHALHAEDDVSSGDDFEMEIADAL